MRINLGIEKEWMLTPSLTFLSLLTFLSAFEYRIFNSNQLDYHEWLLFHYLFIIQIFSLNHINYKLQYVQDLHGCWKLK